MHFYSAKVRLKGDVRNEVLKKNISVAEILILRKLHGNDSVVDLKLIGDKRVKDSTERQRLSTIYRRGLKHNEPSTSIEQLFGAYAPLPQRLDDVEEFRKAPEEEEGEDETLEEEADKTRKATARRKGRFQAGNKAAVGRRPQGSPKATAKSTAAVVEKALKGKKPDPIEKLM